MKIKNYLQKLGINFKEFKHPAVYTCEEAEKYNKNIRGIHSKNLFLKNRKSKRFYLVILPADKKLDLDELGKKISDNLKFAKENDLKEILGVKSGAVSPFGLINDKKNKVIAVIDSKVWNPEYVSFHSNINTETLELTKSDFHKYINSLKNELKILQNGN